jgi:hypothetical protein
LYAVYFKNHPTPLTVFEVYADQVAYEAHLKTAHFMKYKAGILRRWIYPIGPLKASDEGPGIGKEGGVII